MENYCSTIEVAHLKIKHIPETGFGGILIVIVEQLRRFRQFAIRWECWNYPHFEDLNLQETDKNSFEDISKLCEGLRIMDKIFWNRNH